ncbi:MAG: biotin--[acetyl-CoA-carboxylase] ligase [Bacteroidota bacterium]|nr:biotin--[acetyl-CoA-carboxylase] ligase [Bacteroidota bacterium]
MLFSSEKIIVLESTESTNNYAMALIRNGQSINENAVFALEQTNGKGRRGKDWKSRKSENIILSIMLQMQWLPVSYQFRLSVAAALGCYDLISKYIPSGTTIKWPNDIFINDSKAGGILIENVIKGTLWQWTVIGIGININQINFEEYNFHAVSLKQITGKDYDIMKLAEQLHESVLKRISELKSGNFPKMINEYNENLFGKNRLVKLKAQNVVFKTKIIAVSASGQLITQDVFERHFNFDEVEYKEFL